MRDDKKPRRYLRRRCEHMRLRIEELERQRDAWMSRAKSYKTKAPGERLGQWRWHVCLRDISDEELSLMTGEMMPLFHRPDWSYSRSGGFVVAAYMHRPEATSYDGFEVEHEALAAGRRHALAYGVSVERVGARYYS